MKSLSCILSGVFTVLTINVTYCQLLHFKKTYDYFGGAEWAGGILPLSSDTVLISCFYGGLTGQGISLVTLEESGNIVASTEFEKPGCSYFTISSGSLVQLDNNYYIGGLVEWPDVNDPFHYYSDPFITKYDLNNDTVWVKHIDTDSNYCIAISFKKTSDKNLLICGTIATSIPGLWDIFLMKIDTSGHLVWEKKYGSGSLSELCSDVAELPDGSLIVSGMKQYSGSIPDLNYRLWLIRTDANGNLTSSKLFSWPSMYYGGLFLRPSLFGGFWICGYTDSTFNAGDDISTNYIGRLDESLNIEKRFFFNSKWFTDIWDFYELPCGNIIFCGSKKDSITNRQNGFIAQIDSNGVLIWWRTYSESPLANNYLSCIRPMPDGGFIACGSADGITSQSQDAWVVRTDSNGCAITDCTTGINSPPTFKQSQISIFPNPATTEVNISLNRGTWKDDVIISVYDLTGKKILQLIPRPDLQTIQLNTKNWSSGIYSIIVQETEGEFIGKLIIVK